MKEIILASGEITIVDSELFEHLNSYSWHLCNNYPAHDFIYGKEYLHTYIFKIKKILIPKNLSVDHINRIKLHNWFTNLRLVTETQNGLNAKLSRKNTTGYKGVYWDKIRKYWYAQICIKGTQISLGTFSCVENAIKARQNAEQRYFT